MEARAAWARMPDYYWYLDLDCDYDCPAPEEPFAETAVLRVLSLLRGRHTGAGNSVVVVVVLHAEY
jgi:hypothetical protein